MTSGRKRKVQEYNKLKTSYQAISLEQQLLKNKIEEMEAQECLEDFRKLKKVQISESVPRKPELKQQSILISFS